MGGPNGSHLLLSFSAKISQLLFGLSSYSLKMQACQIVRLRKLGEGEMQPRFITQMEKAEV